VNVGRVSNINYIAAVGRVNSPAMRYVAPSVSPTAPATRPNQGSNSLFFSLDGDSAEISGRARGLSFLGPGQRPVGPGVLNNFQFDLPAQLVGNIPVKGMPSGMLGGEPTSGQGPEAAEGGHLEVLESQGVCHTCENRRYVDQSNDASVSFQTPTKISPNMAAAAVAAHENEHVRNEQARAHREGRDIVSQSVTLTYDVCPECGRHYVSGGTTRTTSVDRSDSDDSDESENVMGDEESSQEDMD